MNLFNKVYSGNLSEEQIKKIFNQLDVNQRGKFTINDFLNLSDIIQSDPTLVAFDYEIGLWKK